MPNDLPDWSPAVLLGTKVAEPAAPGNTSGSFQLPVGTKSLVIITVVAAGDTSSLGLTGHTTGFQYYGAQFNSGAYEIIGCEQEADAQIDFTASHGSGGGVTWTIIALPFPPPSFISRTPAPWQVPNTPAPFNHSIPFGTSQTWITPPTGARLRLFSGFLHWRTSTNGFGAIKGDGTTGGLQNYDQVATNFLMIDYGGIRLATNEKLVVSNDDVGNGQSMNGGLVYNFE